MGTVIRVAIVAVLVAGIAAAPGRVAAAGSVTLFVQSFRNNTIDPAYPVILPALPGGGGNPACLTASGNNFTGILRSCRGNNDFNGRGKLRLTTATQNQEGGVLAATSVPTSAGIDATFSTYQYGGNGADGISFVLAAVDPANPVAPGAMGEPGGALGYSADAGTGTVGLAHGYLGIGLDVWGNFSNIADQGTGCANPPYLVSGTNRVPGQVVIRGPGNGTVGYCALNSTATSGTSPPLTLRAATRTAAVVPVEVVINPTTGSFTTPSGLTAPAGTYKVAFTPVGGALRTLSGPLPAVPGGLYPSSSWTTPAGLPKQIAFGWAGSTGTITDFHEVDLANVASFTPVPQLTVSQTSYSTASPALGAPVTYTVAAGVASSGAAENGAITVSQTLPAGVTPVGAYGPGWTCSPPSGQVISCTNSGGPFAPGAALPPLTVEGIVTASGVTSGTVQSTTTATASSADGDPAIATSTTAGTLPATPSAVTVSPASGPVAGGNQVTVSGANLAAATAIEIGTTAQQQAGTPVVLLPCPAGPAPGCFTVNANGTLTISAMPPVAAPVTVNVTVVTLGVAGAAAYAYTAVPAAPAAPTATAGTTSATVSWSPPVSSNSPITGYVVTPFLNGVAQPPLSYDASTTTRTITGLTAGASYTFTVAAINAVGTGPASPQSAAVIPYTLPGAPTIGAVSAGDSSATVSWTAPASDGFSPITGYVVTPIIAGVAQAPQTFNSTATTEQVVVHGLTPGTTYTFKVAAINAAGTGPASAMSSAVTINAGVALQSVGPPNGEVSVGYSYAPAAAGGTGPFTWSVSAGSLPPGLSMNAATGLVSGTPTTAGSYPVTVQVTDSTGSSATKAVTLVIAAVPSLANPAPPPGQAGISYSDALAVTGGTGPFTWSVSAGSLPPGLSLNASTGVVSGTPTAVGLYTFTARVTDAFGLTATQALSVTVAVGPIVISASADNSTVTPRQTLHYTITIANTATTAFAGVTATIPLAGVLDDATYNADAAATSGAVSFAGPSLTWTGSLAAGATATVTFSATVNSPFSGNGRLSLTVTSATVGTNCPASTTDARCTVSVPVSALTIAVTTTVAVAAPGTVVGFTVTVTNSGQVAYSGATLSVPLAGVLDDATWGGDAAATSGAASFTSPDLAWTGNLAPGQVATMTFSVTVIKPDAGDQILSTVVTSPASGSNCASGSTDARCAAAVPVQALLITSSASVTSTTPGSTVQYTVTVTDTGMASYTGATFTAALAGLADDAAYNGDAVATSGSLAISGTNGTWTGDLAPGQTVTMTFSVTARNPDTGNKLLTTTITSPTAGSNCPTGGTDPACSTSVTVLVPALTITVSSSAPAATPGSTVGYTVTVVNSGQTPYSAASVAISAAKVLDDATYNTDAAATTGSVSFASPVLTWTGDLAAGGSATITYSVTVNNPDAGDKVLTSTLTSTAAGSNCPPGGTDSRCSNIVAVLTPALDLIISANAATTTVGATIRYTITADNVGQTDQPGVSLTAPLAGVLDDATWGGDAVASTGSVSFSGSDLTWTGPLAMGAIATITFSVTVTNPDGGNKILTTTLTSTTAGSNCLPGSTADPDCSSAVPVASLAITNAASVATTTPGGTVRYTATLTNTGQVPYTGITVTTDAADVFDDAVLNGDQTATSGTISVTGTTVSWTGNIPVGATVTVTGTVTVHDPDPGNKLMTSTLTTTAAGSNCGSGSADPACTTTVHVLVPALTISNAPSATTPVPGSVVGYTLTITNTGQTGYTGITVTDSLAAALDDAAYNADAAATAGPVGYASGILTWTGSLAPGASATVTFSVTVNAVDSGDKLLVVTAASAAAGSSCPPGTTSAPCRSFVAVLTPALVIVAGADASTAEPGTTVHYTLTFTNTGQTAYTAITVTDSLAGLVDDAAYNADAAATGGTVGFASPDLTWTGSLAVGASATVTFSATVNNPDTGDRSVTTAITSAAAGSNCPSGSADARCYTTVTVASAAELTISLSSGGTTSTVAGDVVRYTVTVTNAALTAYSGASFTDSLAGVLDDATYNADAAATAGTASFTSPDLSWTGTVAAQATATITFSVTVHNPDAAGNMILASTLTSAATGSNCPSGSTDPRCASTVTVSQLVINSTADVSFTTPGGVVRYTTTLTNAGQTAYHGISMTADGSGIADDGTGNGDQAASSGILSQGTTGATWTGDIPIGATVTLSGSITVNNPDTGNHLVTEVNVSTAPGSNCPAGSADPRCGTSIPVLTPGLTISNTASVSSATPGGVVGYTLTITNSGQTSYSAITVTDSLASVPTDATSNGDAAATAGAVSYASGVLTWTGSLAPGDSAVVTFSVTVNDPDTGGKLLIVSAASTADGSGCPPGTITTPCRSDIRVLTPGLTITAAADTAKALQGTTVRYTVTITDTGQTSYSGATVADSLAGVLDDATYNADATATSGTVAYTSPSLTWTGSLAPGGSATVSFSATVTTPDTGDASLATTATSAAAGNNCPAGSTDPSCVTTVPVALMTITIVPSTATATPGTKVTYTITLTDGGSVDIGDADLTIPLADVLDDASWGGDAAANIGATSFTSPDLTWTGDLLTEQPVTITFSVTVNNPDTGNKTLASTLTSTTAGSSCPPSGPAPAACTATVTVLVPAMTITTTANSSDTTPGSTVQYTITITNTGQTSYTGATVTADLSGLLTDAAYNGDAVATAGTVGYTSPALTWTGDLAPGAAVTITYSVTVDNPPGTGDKRLLTAVTSAEPGSTCAAGAACTNVVRELIPGLTITKTASVATTTPGSVVTYTLTVADTGQTSYAGATVTDDLTSVLASAAWGGDASVTAGTASYASPVLTWTGDLAPGAAATITYSVTIKNPLAGAAEMTNTAVSAAAGSNCAADSSDPRCIATVGIVSGPLSVTTPGNTALGAAAPGGTVAGSLGTVQVVDGRGFGANWTATVASTDFTTGGGSPAETIPAGNATYSITGLTGTTGPAVFQVVPSVGLTANPQAVISATNVTGNTDVSWTPQLQVAIPGGAIGGVYSATIFNSVS